MRIAAIVLPIALLGPAALAQSPREQLQQMVEQLQKTPADGALRERILKLGAEVKPAPATPAEAEKFEGRAQYAFRSAKSEAEFLDAAREYLKAVEIAPWIAGYYHDLCVILEKANRPTEAARSCNMYLAGAPQAADASNVRKLVAGLEYALERERRATSRRSPCWDSDAAMYERGGKLATIGGRKISVKLISTLSGGAWRNQIGIYDISGAPGKVRGHRFELNPTETKFRLEEQAAGARWLRLTISRDGRIAVGRQDSPQAEITTSVAEMLQRRNDQLKRCWLAGKDGEFFVALPQGGPIRTKDGSRVAGTLLFAADCKGELRGVKPGWFPAGLVPHPDSPNIRSTEPRREQYTMLRKDACRQTGSGGLGWLSQ